MAKRHGRHCKTQYPELAPLTFKVTKADLGELGVTYRLIAGPLDAPPPRSCAMN